ncbi:hypothetical protein RIF29_04941 [Crotalaria pallida]|uniref:PB1-like domain-containing protein n=1 Tax=Crotalaria pallida TaxID=3830 RepID=A0AAN9J418_CROPI
MYSLEQTQGSFNAPRPLVPEVVGTGCRETLAYAGYFTSSQCDSERWCYWEFVDILKDLRYSEAPSLWYLDGNENSHKGLKEIRNDGGALKMLNISKEHGDVVSFVLQPKIEVARPKPGVGPAVVDGVVEVVVPKAGVEPAKNKEGRKGRQERKYDSDDSAMAIRFNNSEEEKDDNDMFDPLNVEHQIQNHSDVEYDEVDVFEGIVIGDQTNMDTMEQNENVAGVENPNMDAIENVKIPTDPSNKKGRPRKNTASIPTMPTEKRNKGRPKKIFATLHTGFS